MVYSDEGQPEASASRKRNGSMDSQMSGGSYYGIITDYTGKAQQTGVRPEGTPVDEHSGLRIPDGNLTPPDRGQSSPHETEEQNARQKQWRAMRNEALRKIFFKAVPYLMQAAGGLTSGTSGNAMYAAGVGWQGSEAVHLAAKQMKFGLDGKSEFNGMVLAGSVMQVIGAGLRAAGNVDGLSNDQQKWLMVGGNTLIGAGTVVSCFPDPPQPEGALRPSPSVAQAACELQPPNPPAASLRRGTTIFSSSPQPGGSWVARGGRSR
ncbi:hypothetical protein ACFZDK_54025 [Streptomyces sp. NPDC007901]|uniref:hypothetical protein n=1 Tax=Streptomyces sp. NPDC007901 TaxID=3364785 RepID=UPI0036E5B4B8